MKKASLSVIVSLLLSVLLFTSVIADNTIIVKEKHLLKYNLKKGGKFTLTGTREATQVQEQGGQEMVSSSKRAYEYVLDVKSMKGNGVVLEMSYKNMSYQSEGQMGTETRDYSALLGKKIEYTLLNNGLTADYVEAEKLPPVNIGSGLMADANYYKQAINNLFPVLPDKPMDIGDTWTYEETTEQKFLSDDGKITTKNSYIYKILEVAKKDGIDCIKIERTYTLKAEGNGQQQGLEILIELEGEGRDIIFFAPEHGMYLSLEKIEKTEGNATVESMGMIIPVSGEQKSTQTVKFE